MARETTIGSGLLERLEGFHDRTRPLRETDPILYLDRVLAHGCMKLDILDAAVRARIGGDRELAARMDRFDRALFQLLSEIGDAVLTLRRSERRGRSRSRRFPGG